MLGEYFKSRECFNLGYNIYLITLLHAISVVHRACVIMEHASERLNF